MLVKMPKQVSINKIIDSIIQGFITAHQSYEEMSGGFWLWNAPEYFITSTVAQNISALSGAKFITLENGSSSAIKDAGARGRGKLPKDIREKGKVDILLWWAGDTPRAVIEIKNQIYSKNQYEKDIKRIKSFLNLNTAKSSLQFGVFAFYESASTGSRKTAEEKVNDRISNIYKNTKEILGQTFYTNLLTSDISIETEDAWQVACILVKPL